jgi:hypothetical protein
MGRFASEGPPLQCPINGVVVLHLKCAWGQARRGIHHVITTTPHRCASSSSHPPLHLHLDPLPLLHFNFPDDLSNGKRSLSNWALFSNFRRMTFGPIENKLVGRPDINNINFLFPEKNIKKLNIQWNFLMIIKCRKYLIINTLSSDAPIMFQC